MRRDSMHHDWPKIIDRTGFFLLGMFGLFYSVFWSSFAEICWKPSFLDFPIFVGEFLLGACILLSLISWFLAKRQINYFYVFLAFVYVAWFFYTRTMGYSKFGLIAFRICAGEFLLFISIILFVTKWSLTKRRFNKVYLLLTVLYILWIIGKALQGYIEYGPLAFRTAALFYYPLFAIVAFSFYRRRFFNQQIIIGILLIMFLVKRSLGIMEYFTFPYFALSIVLLLKIEKRWIRYSLFFLLLCLFPPASLFLGSRSFLMGNIAALMFLSFCFIFGFLDLAKRAQLRILTGMVFIMVLGIATFAGKNQVTSLVTPFKVIEEFRQQNRMAQEYIKVYDSPKIPVRLYNKDQNTANTFYLVLNRNNLVASFPEKQREMEMERQRISALSVKNGFSEDSVINSNFESLMDDIIARMDEFYAVDRKKEISKGSRADERGQGNVPFSGGKQPPGSLSSLSLRETVPGKKVLLDELRLKMKSAFMILKSESVKNLNQMSVFEREPRLLEKEITEYLEKNNEVFLKTENIFLSKITEINFLNKEEKKVLQDDIELNRKLSLMDLNKAKEEIIERVRKKSRPLLSSSRTLNTEYSNIIFRLLVWEDMLRELFKEKGWWGVSFGKPQRSPSIEVLLMAWGEWNRDGWIAPHNVFLHMIYRAGIVGLIFILGILFCLRYMTKEFIRLQSPSGLFLVSILVYWLVVANFLVVLELPHQAIPFWGVWGVTLAYMVSLKKKKLA